MYDIGNYYSASTVDEALGLMREHPGARLIAGGSDVLIKIREGKMAGTDLIAIRDIKEMQAITLQSDGTICIGALATFAQVESDPVICEHIPYFAHAVGQAGGPQLRNIGTIGGNICNGAVSADSVPTLVSLEARLRIVGPEGERFVMIEDFYDGPGKVRLNTGEMLTHIFIPESCYKGWSGHYIKYSMRNAMDIATISCCVMVKANAEQKMIEDIHITFGVAAPVPIRCRKAEMFLKGQPISPELKLMIAGCVREEINPRDSWRASKDFRRHIGGEIAARAMCRAVMSAGACMGVDGHGGECDV